MADCHPIASGAPSSLIPQRLIGVRGRWSAPRDLVFEFDCADGSEVEFTVPEMERATWWHFLDASDVACISSHLKSAAGGMFGPSANGSVQ